MKKIKNYVTRTYSVDKNNKKIKCTLISINDIPSRLEKYGIIDSNKDFEKQTRDIYVGFAKCDPKDDWDEDFGKKLAEYRAAKARKEYINNYIDNYIKKEKLKLDNLEKYGKLKEARNPIIRYYFEED